jgi:hypothetical protein
MTRATQTRILTVAALAVAALVAIGVKRPAALVTRATPAVAPKTEATPQDAIYAMLDAARLGDVRAYLAAYTGQMAADLQQTLAETTEAGFVRYLQDSNAAIRGVALSDPQTLTDREVKLRVEYVYQDRNEAQTVYLVKEPAGWKIARVESAERVKTLVPYGTPVQ